MQLVLDARRGLGRNAAHKTESQRPCRPRVHDLAIRTVGVNFGKGFDVLGGIGVHAGKKIRGFSFRPHSEADGTIADVHTVGGFYRHTTFQRTGQIRTAGTAHAYNKTVI